MESIIKIPSLPLGQMSGSGETPLPDGTRVLDNDDVRVLDDGDTRIVNEP